VATVEPRATSCSNATNETLAMVKNIPLEVSRLRNSKIRIQIIKQLTRSHNNYHRVKRARQ
jgi:hypothetical protein